MPFAVRRLLTAEVAQEVARTFGDQPVYPLAVRAISCNRLAFAKGLQVNGGEATDLSNYRLQRPPSGQLRSPSFDRFQKYAIVWTKVFLVLCCQLDAPGHDER